MAFAPIDAVGIFAQEMPFPEMTPFPEMEMMSFLEMETMMRFREIFQCIAGAILGDTKLRDCLSAEEGKHNFSANFSANFDANEDLSADNHRTAHEDEDGHCAADPLNFYDPVTDEDAPTEDTSSN